MKTENTIAGSQNDLFEPGQTLGGRYQVISCLGRGGMGVVYHVIQVFLNQELALKTIDKRGITDEAMLRFQKEARTAFAVKHPNIIAVDDFGLLDDQTPFLVMELIRGETLAEKLKRKTSLPVSDAIPMFIQLCSGLDYAHKLGVVHRDIKPSNVMVLDEIDQGTEGSIKIVDFGIATFTAEDGTDSSNSTRSSEIFGSPLYMSPEQCTGGQVDNRADIYSLGCVLFETLTGTPPFIGDSALTTMMKHKSAVAPTLREASLGKSFSKELEQVIATMLAKSPDQRYQSASAVAKDLAATISGDAIRKPVARPVVEATGAIPKPLSLPRSIFFTAILSITLLSATLAGFAGYEIKHIQMEQPIIEVIQDKANVVSKAAEDPILLDEETVEKVQIVNPLQLAKRLRRPEPDGHISLHFQKFDREELQMIANTKWISLLDLEQSILANKDLDVFAQLPKLTKFIAKASNFNDDGAAALAHCNKLEVVSASGTPLTDKGLAKLANHQTINNFDLNGTNITDVGLKSLGTMKQLGHLELTDDPKITNNGLKYLRNCSITELAVDGNPNIGDDALTTLSKFPLLSNVVLSRTNVSLKGLKELCSNPAVREIYVVGCKRVSEKDVAELHEEAPRVTVHSRAEKPTVELDL